MRGRLSPASSLGPSFPLLPGFVLGAGLAAMVDGFVLHQLLQWHHMASAVEPAQDIAGLRFNVTLDGMLQAGSFVLVLTGLVLLWSSRQNVHRPGAGRRFWGSLLAGVGAFNLLEGVIDHHIVGLHHVNELAPQADWPAWDYGFLALSAMMTIIGLWLAGPRRS